MVITYPTPAYCSGESYEPSAANGFFYLWVAGILALAAVFFSYKPLTLTVLPYKTLAHAAVKLDEDLVKSARAAGVTQVEVRPWSWLDRSPAVKFTIEGESRTFERINDSNIRLPYQLTLAADGIGMLSAASRPTAVEEAKTLRAFVHSHLRKVLEELEKAKQDAEYVRTGQLPDN